VFNVPLDATAKDKNKETYKHYMACFEDGTPEDWCSLRTEAHDLFLAMGIEKDPEKKHNIWRSLLKGQAKDRFTAIYNATRVENDAKTDQSTKLTPDQILRVVLNGVAKHVFTNWQFAVRNQKQYMQHGLSMGTMEPGAFCERLQKMNRFLIYFPTKHALIAPSVFSEDELLNIVGLAVPVEWSITMLTTNQGIETFDTMESAVIYFKQLHQADKLRKQLGVITRGTETANKNNNHDNNRNTRNKKRANDDANANTDGNGKKPKPLTKCPHCGKMGTHKPEECRSNPANQMQTVVSKLPVKQKHGAPAAKASANAMQIEEAATAEAAGEQKDSEFEDLDAFLNQLRGN
jgi:hypothetical protein